METLQQDPDDAETRVLLLTRPCAALTNVEASTYSKPASKGLFVEHEIIRELETDEFSLGILESLAEAAHPGAVFQDVNTVQESDWGDDVPQQIFR